MSEIKHRSERLSIYAMEKIVEDFFPQFSDDFLQEDFDSEEMSLHAGALCLYAATLLTRVYDPPIDELQLECEARQEALFELVEEGPKFSQFSDDEIETMVSNLIKKDIRNSFAHGNFEISCDVYTKKLNFVLMPKRRDFVTDEPIIVSKKALLDANKKAIEQLGFKYSWYVSRNAGGIDQNEVLKRFLLPVELLKMAEYYLDKKKSRRADFVIDEKKAIIIYNTLLATKMLYEQDDYYNNFGKNSSIFDKVARVRNAVAHDKFDFSDLAKKVEYRDGDRVVEGSIEKIVAMQWLADAQKNAINSVRNNENLTSESIENLKEVFKIIFDYFLCGEGNVEELFELLKVDLHDQGAK